MASCSLTSIKFSAVVKGYHAYRDKMTDANLHKCVPEPENCLDINAVAVKSSTDEVVGHVPAIPVKLNVAILKFLKLDNCIQVHCRATGPPRISKNPAQHRKGGGVVLPAEYQVSAPSAHVREVIRLIETEFNVVPDLKEPLALSVEQPGERTPPMVLSDEPKFPDTPDFHAATP